MYDAVLLQLFEGDHQVGHKKLGLELTEAPLATDVVA